MITPHQAYEFIVRRRLVNPSVEMLEFIQNAPTRQLQEFVLLSRNIGIEGAFNKDWIEQAKISMNVRIGEDNVLAANLIIKQLIEQTDVLAGESRKLASLTEQLNKQKRVSPA